MKGICDTLAPPQREMALRHIIACHLDEATLRAMKPVITIEPGEKWRPGARGGGCRRDFLMFGAMYAIVIHHDEYTQNEFHLECSNQSV